LKDKSGNVLAIHQLEVKAEDATIAKNKENLLKKKLKEQNALNVNLKRMMYEPKFKIKAG